MRKPSKQHRFECLASKLHRSVVTRSKLYSYMRKYRLKYQEHVLKKRNVHNNGAEWQQSSWRSRRHEKVFYVYIKQCSDV